MAGAIRAAAAVLLMSALWLGGDAVRAQTAWQPPAPLAQVPLWPEGAAIARPEVTGPEMAAPVEHPRPGREWTYIRNVTRPTMTIYPPKGHNSGAAVMVFPGGGYEVLAIDLEGSEICDWLTGRGITCVLVKYRVPWGGPHYVRACDCHQVPAVPMALQDAQRAIRLVRARAAALGVDPHRIGVIGFSAGGHLVADVSNAAPAYAAVDSADAQSPVPNFAIALYPGHLWLGKEFALNPAVKPTAATPPTFLLQAEDDAVDDVRHSLVYYLALKDAGVPVEMHLFAHGGHAFGLRAKGEPVGEWPGLVEKWMRGIGVWE